MAFNQTFDTARFGATEGAFDFRGKATAVLGEMMKLSEQNLETTLNAAKGLAEARTLPDASRIQYDWFKESLAAFGERSRKVVEIMMDLSGEMAGQAKAAGDKAFEAGRDVAQTTASEMNKGLDKLKSPGV